MKYRVIETFGGEGYEVQYAETRNDKENWITFTQLDTPEEAIKVAEELADREAYALSPTVLFEAGVDVL